MELYQKGKTDLDFTAAKDSKWQWHQLGHMQVCNSLQTDNHASTPPLSFLQAGCPSCHPTNSVKALKAKNCVLTYLLPASHLNNIIRITCSRLYHASQLTSQVGHTPDTSVLDC